MNASTIRCFLAMLLAVAPAAALSASHLTLTFGTGEDDLRGGRDVVHVTVYANDGRVIGRLMNANGSRAWGGRTTNSVGLPLADGTSDEIGAIELTTTFAGGLSGDNWNLDHFRVVPQGAPREIIFEARGTPLFRFTGEQRSQRFVVMQHACRVDLDCDDGAAGNGPERCVAAPRALDSQPLRTCAAGARAPCTGGTVWSDAERRCVAGHATDRDGDGADAIADGGDDCDDEDPLRFPGAAEVCDALGRDEDCDFRTFGSRDGDADGHVSAQCFNWGPPARR
jgi:hypothetical protein